MIRSDKLYAATAGVGVDVAAWMQRFAAPCSALPRPPEPRNDEKTNPTPPPAASVAAAPTVSATPAGRSAPGGLSPLQRVAAIWLGQGRKVACIARELGVDRGTVFRWKRLPRFAAEVEQETMRFVQEKVMSSPPTAHQCGQTGRKKLHTTQVLQAQTRKEAPPAHRQDEPIALATAIASSGSAATCAKPKTPVDCVRPPAPVATRGHLPFAVGGRARRGVDYQTDVVTGLNRPVVRKQSAGFDAEFEVMMRELEDEIQQLRQVRSRHGLQRSATECSALQRAGGECETKPGDDAGG
jgi:hypothetical protein